MSAERLGNLLNRLGRKKWNVRLCARYAHGHGVSLYLARYVKGGPLRNSQIVHASEREIRLCYRAHEEGTSGRGSATLALSPERFIERLLRHAPEPGRHTVRHYGLYAHARSRALDAARALHQQAPAQSPAPLSWQSYLDRLRLAGDPRRCPQCGARLRQLALPRLPLPCRPLLAAQAIGPP